MEWKSRAFSTAQSQILGVDFSCSMLVHRWPCAYKIFVHSLLRCILLLHFALLPPKNLCQLFNDWTSLPKLHHILLMWKSPYAFDLQRKLDKQDVCVQLLAGTKTTPFNNYAMTYPKDRFNQCMRLNGTKKEKPRLPNNNR